MSKTAVRLALILVIMAGTGVRAYQLTARSLWFDEAFSWRLIQFPLRDMLRRAAADVHPPLYYLLLKGWRVVFSDSLLAMRSFSVMLAAVTIAAAYLLAASAFRSRTAGLAAAAFIAAAPFQIQYAWEARMYTLGTALALLSTWALLRAVRTAQWRYALLYSLLAAAFAYTHYYAFFTLAAHLLFVSSTVIARTRGRLGEILQWRLSWQTLCAALLVAALFLPWLPTFLAQSRQVQAAFWIPRLGGWSIPDTLYRLYWPTVGIPPHEGTWQVLLTSLPLITTVAMWLSLRRVPPPSGAYLILTSATIPFFIAIAYSVLAKQSIYQDRFFVFAHLFILIGWAGLCSRVPRTAWRTAAIFAAVFFLTVSSLHYRRELNIPAKPGARAAAHYLFSARQEDQPVIVSSPFIYFAISHYAEQDFARDIPRLYSETHELAHFAGGPILTPTDITGPAVFTADSNTLWVVDTTGFGSQPLAVPFPWRAVAEQTFPEVFPYQGTITVTQYTR